MSPIGDPRELTIDRYNHRYGDGRIAGHELLRQRRPGARRRLGALRLRQLRHPRRQRRRLQPPRQRQSATATGPRRRRATFVPIYPNGFLPLIVSEIERRLRRRRACAARSAAGAPICRSSTAPTGSTIMSRTASTPRSAARSARAASTPAGCASARPWSMPTPSARSRPASSTSSRSPSAPNIATRISRSSRATCASYINGPFSAAALGGAAGGAQVFPGFRPNNEVDESRDSFAAYVELDADITERLSLQVAGRYEHYSDFGSTLNGKIAGRLRAGRRRRAARLGLDRLPRAVAPPAILHRHLDQQCQRRADRGRHLPGHRPGLGRARRAAARSGEVAQHGRRHRADPGPRAQPHRRRLPDRDRRPHRAHREPAGRRPVLALLQARGHHQHHLGRASSSTASTPAPAASTSSAATGCPTWGWAGSR